MTVCIHFQVGLIARIPLVGGGGGAGGAMLVFITNIILSELIYILQDGLF